MAAICSAGLAAPLGCAQGDGDPADGPGDIGKADNADPETLKGYEFIVIGSGAGGGPLAANLARNGHSVLLLEAGTDQTKNLKYQIPAWHTQSTEDPDMRWDYFVKHYDNPPGTDSKDHGQDIYYPRAGTLGGCTAHNAMITVYPHDSDWKGIADATGDHSWDPANMRKYFTYLERNGYVAPGTAGHGFKDQGIGGHWLSTEQADPTIALTDTKLLAVVTAAVQGFVHQNDTNFFQALLTNLTRFVPELTGLMKRDLNAQSPGRDSAEDFFTIPLATNGGKRNGTADYLLATLKDPEVAANHRLRILTNALVTKILFERNADGTPKLTTDGKLKAIGVEYMAGSHLYRADRNASGPDGQMMPPVFASKEVILSAGAFNSPQLLKLSGIGPADELNNAMDHNGNPNPIEVLKDLPGVGGNLQDRYEIGVVSETRGSYDVLSKCTFDGTPSDQCFSQWNKDPSSGPYTTNGGVLGIVKRSTQVPVGGDPDLFIFGLPAYFKGYELNYSPKISSSDDGCTNENGGKGCFTWAVLKAHTGNTAGTVKLRSTDARDTPLINFHQFDEGTNDQGQSDRDATAVMEGVKLARDIGARADGILGSLLTAPVYAFNHFKEIWPADQAQNDKDLRAFVKRESWGHHASCTLKIGDPANADTVLDSNFHVKGTTGLRVVDASVFPKIPGFFIVVPVYMVSEKATDAILKEDFGEDRRR
jgi:choline dehydrogenase